MIVPPHAPNSLTYRQVIRGYLRLHQLTIEGRDESPDADAVRDSLDLPWRALTAKERDQIQGLSADLFSISESNVADSIDISMQAQRNLAEALEANKLKEWERALGLLRGLNNYIAPAILSYLRGGIWSEAGYPEVGVVFYEHAAKLEPDNVNFAALVLIALEQCDPRRAQEMANKILRDPGQHSPSLVVKAGGILFNATREMAEPDTAAVFRLLIPILTTALARFPENESRSVYVAGLLMIALSHEHFGESGAAVENYSRGLQIDPSNDALLTGRGVLTYGKSPQSPSDLEQAVKLRSSLVWPYFFLAHHYVLNNRYEECRRMCERGLGMYASDAVRSQLSEWLAIAEAELGFPSERVRAAFEQAVRLDPSNEMARRNLERFEQSLARPTTPKGWEKRSENAVRVFGQAERRVPLAA